MDLSRVRHFLAICERGSFTAAARVCGVSQPSVTSSIRRLERALGGRLFERRKPIRLTPFGMEMRPLFENLIAAVERITASLAERQQQRLRQPRSLLGRTSSRRTAILSFEFDRRSASALQRAGAADAKRRKTLLLRRARRVIRIAKTSMRQAEAVIARTTGVRRCMFRRP